MIPDGTSANVLSLTRWYQWYQDTSKHNLNIDPLITGMVHTHSSNAPIGDSAPTSSWYSTGSASQTGYIAMYPPADPKRDLVLVNPDKKYQPLLTVLEAAKLSGKSTGLVFTCQFPHATPADFSAHWYDRGNYGIIAKQMFHNDIDVVFGGGSNFLSSDTSVLTENNTKIIKNDISAFRNNKNPKTWALFTPVDLPFDMDNDASKIPSLSEMTEKALELLSQNENGFFMMIEGSKIDWAAHANDPIGLISDYAAFDKALGAVMKFAKSNQETVVVICPDHANSGVSIGNARSNKGYDTLSIREIMQPLVDCKMTTDGFTNLYISELTKGKNTKPDSLFIAQQFSKFNSKIRLTNAEIGEISQLSDSFLSVYTLPKSKVKDKLQSEISKTFVNILNARTYIGFTTHGHTADDVFLAAYSPLNDVPHGIIGSADINEYLCKSLGMKGSASLKDSTAKYFARHDEVFTGSNINLYKNDTLYTWNPKQLIFDKGKKTDKSALLLSKQYPLQKNDIILIVKKGSTTIEIPAYTNKIFINGKCGQNLNTVAVYVDKNNTFYLPKHLNHLLLKN